MEEGEYLQQLILYIHLDPVSAGLVKDPADYRWRGHGEVLEGRRKHGLVDADETLAAFEPTRRAAIVRYRSSTASGEGLQWQGEGPGRLPWWRLGRPPKGLDDELELDRGRPRIGMDGMSDRLRRPRVELEELMEASVRSLGCSLDEVRSRKRSRTVVTAREVLAWVAVERYRFPVREVARGLEEYVETASRLVSRAAQRRQEERGFRDLVSRVDAAVTAETEITTR